MRPLIIIVSKYAPLPDSGSNPRWYELASRMSQSGYKCEIITSDSNHGSSIRPITQAVKIFDTGAICYHVIRTTKYIQSASMARVISWFDFDLKLFLHCRKMAPDVVVVSSLSLTSIILEYT